MTHLILALMAGLAAIAAFAQEHEHGVSRKDAEEFIDKVERELPIENEYVNRVAWIASNFITPDTEWLSAKVTAERAAAAVVRAKTAARFDGTEVDPLTRRKLELMKRGLTLAPPEEPGAAQELARLQVRLETAYSTGKVAHCGKQIFLDEVEDIMRTSRDPEELRSLWEGWHAIAIPMRQGLFAPDRACQFGSPRARLFRHGRIVAVLVRHAGRGVFQHDGTAVVAARADVPAASLLCPRTAQ